VDFLGRTGSFMVGKKLSRKDVKEKRKRQEDFIGGVLIG
jgi:hypothetical protein